MPAVKPPVYVHTESQDQYMQELVAIQLAKKMARERLQRDDPELAAKAKLAPADQGVYGELVFEKAPARHHQTIIELVRQCINDELSDPDTGYTVRKVLILAPPGTAKTWWANTVLAPWYLGNHPDHHVLMVTSSDDNAKNYGGAVRRALEDSPLHREIFPDPRCRPNKDFGWSGDGFCLAGLPMGAKDPSYRAIGFGTSVVGARTHLMLVDDPLDQKSSDSVTVVADAKRYYTATLETRPGPHDHAVAVMTRWNDNDFASFLIASGEWLVIRMPMEAEVPDPDDEEMPPDPTLTVNGGWREPGDLLWPELFDQEWWEQLKHSGTRLQSDINCIYQCNPTGVGGDLFESEDWLQPLPVDFYEPRDDGRSMRDRLTILMASDLAYSDKKKSAQTCHMVAGIDRNLNTYLLHVWADNASDLTSENAAVSILLKWRPKLWLIEDAAFRSQATKDFVRRVVGQCLKARFPIKAKVVHPDAKKEVRARLPAARAQHGMFYVDRTAKWYRAFRDQTLGFPNTKYKDQVDSLGIIAHEVFEKPDLQEKQPMSVMVDPDSRGGRSVARTVLQRLLKAKFADRDSSSD